MFMSISIYLCEYNIIAYMRVIHKFMCIVYELSMYYVYVYIVSVNDVSGWWAVKSAM